ncbi:YtxH domain-containing protein [Lysinibacillus sp. 54212]|uniref:YtxH domain-containing protein n=1 Tax=Lysinibacillus sp. 54212 TaxID=3119829 RepID=UPI002FC6FCA7
MKSKLVPAVVLGALVGAAISLFDKQTREHTIASTKKVKDTVTYYAQNRDELQNLIETKVEQAQTFYSTAEQNITSIMEKVEDAKTLPTTVSSLLSETKEAFSKQDSGV